MVSHSSITSDDGITKSTAATLDVSAGASVPVHTTAQLSHDDQFKNGNLILKTIYEKNIIFTADVQLYLTKISFGSVWGQTGGRPPWCSLRS